MIEEIENILSNSNKVKVKIFSLEYTIERINDMYRISADLYSNRYSEYKSIKEMFDNYTIYNEPIKNNIGRINII